jgi:hypothetical protein
LVGEGWGYPAKIVRQNPLKKSHAKFNNFMPAFLAGAVPNSIVESLIKGHNPSLIFRGKI